MVSAVALRIISRAVAIRVAEGENIDAVLESYTKLSAEQKKQIKKEYQK